MTCDHRRPLLLPDEPARCGECRRRFNINCLATCAIAVIVLVTLWARSP